MLSARGQKRMKDWDSGDTFQLPYTHCRRRDIPDWEGQRTDAKIEGSAEYVLEQAIQEVDSDFEVLAVAFTGAPGTPCHHLYRRTTGTGDKSAEDVMALQFSIQEQPQYDWPSGVPEAPEPPGRIVRLILKYHDARLHGDPIKAKEERRRLSDEAYAKAEEAADAPLCDFENELNELVAPYLLQGRSVPHYLSHAKHRGPKVSVAAPDMSGVGQDRFVPTSRGILVPG